MTQDKRGKTRRREPVQARAKDKVEWVLEASARVFKAEGFAATTNRIAEVAGVGVGTLYEYFPNKQALLTALAERHVVEAERALGAALALDAPCGPWLSCLQRAIVASQRYPSQALDLVTAQAGPALLARAAALRERVLIALTERARRSGRPEPAVRARIVFSLIGELSSRSTYQASDRATHEATLRQLLELAVAHMEDGMPSRNER